jgi:hypothetical protein
MMNRFAQYAIGECCLEHRHPPNFASFAGTLLQSVL